MYISCLSDELCVDLPEALPILKDWGLEYVDLRNRVFGKCFEDLSGDELKKAKRLLGDHGMRIGCLQASLAKVHLPDAGQRKKEQEKLERIIRIADELDCHLVRSFFYWQPERKYNGRILPDEEPGQLTENKDKLEQVMEYFRPLAERAKEAGLELVFENCGVTPPEIFAFLDAMGLPNLSLAFDAWFWWDWLTGKGLADDPDASTEALIEVVKRTGCVHAKGKGSIPAMLKDGEGKPAPSVPYERVLGACNVVRMKGPVSMETGYHDYNNNEPIEDKKELEGIIENSHLLLGVLHNGWPFNQVSNIYKVARPKPPKPSRVYEDDPVRFVVVGLGMGHNRSKLVTETPGAKLIGVCDLREERAKKSSLAFGVPYELDVRRWLDNKDVEVVYVMTPTGRHLEVAKQALEAGKHVLCTKPMEVSLQAAEEMLELADKHRVLLGIDFQLRYERAATSLKAAIEGGVFGDLLGGRITLKCNRTDDYYKESGAWRGTKRWDGGGVMSNQSVHCIDEVVFALGVPSRVKADLWTQTHDIEGEDLGVGIWSYDNGAVLSYSATTSYPQLTFSPDFEVYGTDAAFSMTFGGIRQQDEERWFLNNAWTDKAPKVVDPPWLCAADNFAAAVRLGEPLTCDGPSGWRTQSVLDGMYRSAADDGCWIDLATKYR